MVITEDDKEYELIPMSPIRRLEKRMERVEEAKGGNYSKDMFSDIVDIVRMSQMIVDELAKSNDALRIELSKLPSRMDDLIVNMKELVSFIKESGEENEERVSVASSGDTMKPVVERLDELIKTNQKITERNDAMLELLDDVGKKLRRPPVRPMQRPPQQRPLPLKI